MTKATDNTESTVSKDSQSTVFPPDSRISGVSSNGAKHMCYCAMHLQPGESDQPSWTGGKPMINNKRHSGRIHFSDRESTIFEFPCLSTAIILSFRDDDPAEDEMLVGNVTKSKLDEMGLWPTYRDGFKTVTGVECGLLIHGEFENMFEGDPIMEIDHSVLTDRPTFDDAYDDFFSSNTVKTELRDEYMSGEL
ncbi:hypothetical protein L198_07433 [Cryptococcus wingfieldii CBS 7118]|uniref:Uncharacterized protein n=1 Tax=Cryptococcus wingfieldii CBS 7118 TaxID=1295528 RepID=A0A1E3IB64_9TREE|nr:hypothetical protein L198_07433 [Cryptococcus wingfieldii CBS 7118]ODN85869.1 hypothetical protein L198_07433 [Cryptococcus wingfieldii CBS 7118]